MVTSFGDASVNHSTAQGAINTAAYCAYQGLPLPLLLVCEDNGFGISVRTPAGWVQATLSSRPGLRYAFADGTDPAAVYDAAAAGRRLHQGPARAGRLAPVAPCGSAVTPAPMPRRATARPPRSPMTADRDPLLGTATALIESGAAHRRRGAGPARPVPSDSSRHWPRRPKPSRGWPAHPQVMAPLAPRHPALVAGSLHPAGRHRRLRVFGGKLPEDEGLLTLAQAINRTLADELAAPRRA